MQPFLHNDIGDDLRIGGGVKNRAIFFQLTAQGEGIGQIAVVSQCHAAFVMVDYQGLNIALSVAAGGSVADVSNYDFSLAQGSQSLRSEYLVDQSHIPVAGKNTIIIDHNSRAFLPPVLQSVETIVGKGCQILFLFCVNAKYTTLFMNVVCLG